MVNTKVTLCGIEMDNPIIPASGTFGFGYEFAAPIGSGSPEHHFGAVSSAHERILHSSICP